MVCLGVSCVCVEVNFGYLPKLLFTLFLVTGSLGFSWISLLQPIRGASEPQDGSVQPLSCGLVTVRHFVCLLFLFLVCFRYGLWGKLGYSCLCSEYVTDSAISPGRWCVNCKCKSSLSGCQL